MPAHESRLPRSYFGVVAGRTPGGRRRFEIARTAINCAAYTSKITDFVINEANYYFPIFILH